MSTLWKGDSRDMVHVKRIVLMVLTVFLFSGYLFGMSERPAVPPHLQGSWYPGDKEELEKLLGMLLDKTLPISPTLEEEKLVGLVSPHAGIIFSGWTAFHGYKLLKGKHIDTIIIMGPSHYHLFPGVKLIDEGFFRTPLGDIYIDGKLAREIVKHCPFASVDKSLFIKEHSVEIQIPLLQFVLGNDFKVVPVLFGDRNLTYARDFGEILSKVVRGKEGILVVASSDLSHYHSEDTAFYLDRRTLDFVKDADSEGLFSCSERGSCEACGLSPIAALISFARALGSRKGTVLSYSTSAMVTGDKSRVVGYGSVAFFDEGAKASTNLGFTEEDGRFLVRIARETIEGSFEGEDPLKKEFRNIPENLKKSGFGLFVTLTRRGFLRGCIGNIVGGEPLYKLAHDMALEAAFSDPRFKPLEKWETVDLSVEVSILSEPQPVDDLREIEVGRDGLIVEMGGRSGLLLPQVPVELGWDRKTFIERTCEKAGLSPDCWRMEGVRFYRFQAQIF